MKYLYGFKIFFLNSINYRFNTIIKLLFSNLNILIEIMFWVVIYGGIANGTLNNYSLKDMITYYIIGVLFRNFILMQSGFRMTELIKEGGLSVLLLKPFNCNKMNYFDNLSAAMINLIPQFILTVMITPLIHQYFVWNRNLVNSLFLIAFLIISSILSHLVWSLLSYMAFWIEEANAVMWSFAVFFNFISGMFIPLDFFPEWCANVLQYFPTATWGYIPTKVYLNLYSVNEMTALLFINVIWIGIIAVINKLVWNRGIKKYSSIGG